MAIGAVLGALVMAINWLTGVEHSVVPYATEGYGTFPKAGYMSTAVLPCLLVVFGYFGGLLVAMWKKERSNNPITRR